jgi:hypothetical protein
VQSRLGYGRAGTTGLSEPTPSFVLASSRRAALDDDRDTGLAMSVGRGISVCVMPATWTDRIQEQVSASQNQARLRSSNSATPLVG